MEISQFSYKNHNAIIRCKTVPFYFARHFPLEYLHGIDSRINDMDSATLNNKKMTSSLATPSALRTSFGIVTCPLAITFITVLYATVRGNQMQFM